MRKHSALIDPASCTAKGSNLENLSLKTIIQENGFLLSGRCLSMFPVLIVGGGVLPNLLSKVVGNINTDSFVDKSMNIKL